MWLILYCKAVQYAWHKCDFSASIKKFSRKKLVHLHYDISSQFMIDLSQRVDAVKDENLKLKSENQILGQYIENLMAASNVFQAPGDTKGHKSAAKSSKKR